MFDPRMKTVAFRKALRQSLDSSDWRSHAWSKHVLALECVQGWAGRKDPKGNTMLHAYLYGHLSPTHTKAVTQFLKKEGVPDFNWVPIFNYNRELHANRVPQKDTQDRFWLLGSYHCLDDTHWDHWVRTHSRWGIRFKPSAEQALRIFDDDALFASMLIEDWSQREYHGGRLYWPELVAQYHDQWPQYHAGVSILGDMVFVNEDTYVRANEELRSRIIRPQPLELLELP